MFLNSGEEQAPEHSEGQIFRQFRWLLCYAPANPLMTGKEWLLGWLKRGRVDSAFHAATRHWRKAFTFGTYGLTYVAPA
jgi:hypothetical protein